MKSIELTQEEVLETLCKGAIRRSSSIAQGFSKVKLENMYYLSKDVIGMAGEYGLAKMLDRFHDLEVFRCGYPDISGFINVRTTSIEGYPLKLTPYKRSGKEMDKSGMYVLMEVNSKNKPKREKGPTFFELEFPIVVKFVGWENIGNVGGYCRLNSHLIDPKDQEDPYYEIERDKLSPSFDSFSLQVDRRYKEMSKNRILPPSHVVNYGMKEISILTMKAMMLILKEYGYMDNKLKHIKQERKDHGL